MGRGEQCQSIDPGITSHHVNEQKSIAKPTKREIITVDNVHVDFVQVLTTLRDGLVSRRVGNGGEVTNSRGWCAS